MKSIAFKLGLTSAIVTSALVLTGCTAAAVSSSGDSSSSTFSSTDIMFAQMMIPHHQQAIDMATLAESNTTNPDVLALAKQIKDAQGPEIQQMTGWINSAGASMDMGHEMPMAGILTDAQMAALADATGADFDKLFLEGMIAHHQGAISMAAMIAQSTNPEAHKLAEAITSGQTAEIATMQKLLGN